ncbi:MAG: hypothetical protein ACRDTH_22625 [Pseudonocardiaceae bacterium]
MTTVAGGREDSSPEASSPLASSYEARPPEAQASGVNGEPGSRAVEQQETGVSAESAVSEAAAALPQVLKIVGVVVAPTTLLTALMFYFGRQWATGFFRYLGVHFTVLDLTVQDYLIRSVDGLIIPLIVVAGATLLALWAHQLLLEALPAGTRRIVQLVLMPSAVLGGLVLVSLALADVSAPVFPTTYPEFRGLSFSIGVLLLAYGVRLLRLLTAERRAAQRPRRAPGTVAVAEWGALFILVSVGLFWAVGDYANLVGMGRAQQIEATLSSLPDVVAYSEKTLSLQAPGVREVPCSSEAGYQFRYEGLKLVLQSGNQYLFLPSGWTHTNGAAILIPRSETLRLEFSPAGQVRDAIC